MKMSVQKKRVQYGVRLTLACAFLAVTGSAMGRSAPRIHPPKGPHIYSGVVVATREVPAYRYALGGQRDEWGHVTCGGPLSERFPIKRTTLFRVETTTRYFDLSKLCGAFGDFRWPRHFKALVPHEPNFDTEHDWERLVIGDRLKMILEPALVRLSEQSCQKLGLVKAARAPHGVGHRAYLRWQERRRKAVEEHCTYRVPIMRVRLRWSTTQLDASPRPYTQTFTQTWDFRVVGRGPRSAAKTSVIGADYSPTLAPPWDTY